MEKVIAIVIGLWFSLAGIASTISVVRSFKEEGGEK